MDGSKLAGLLQESSRVQVKTHMKRRKNPRCNLYKIFLGGDVKIHKYCKYNRFIGLCLHTFFILLTSLNTMTPKLTSNMYFVQCL